MLLRDEDFEYSDAVAFHEVLLDTFKDSVPEKQTELSHMSDNSARGNNNKHAAAMRSVLDA